MPDTQLELRVGFLEVRSTDTKGVRDGVSVSAYIFKDVFKGLAPSVVGANKSEMGDFGRRLETGGISRTELRKNPLSQKPLVF